jgi:hypothetical protein
MVEIVEITVRANIAPFSIVRSLQHSFVSSFLYHLKHPIDDF